MRMLLVSLSVLFGAATALAADPVNPPTAAFAHRLPLIVDGGEGLYRLELPAAMYQGVAQANLSDLRVVNGAGESVPFAFLPPGAPSEQSRERQPLGLFPVHAAMGAHLDGLDLKLESGNGVTRLQISTSKPTTVTPVLAAYVLDATKVELPIRALVIEGLPEDTMTQVSVDASDDLRNWRSVAVNAPLVHLAAGAVRVMQNRVEIGSSKVKYLRLSWPSGTPAMTLTAVSADLGAEVLGPTRRNVQVAGARQTDAPLDYLFDLGGRFPVDSLRFTLDTANTLAPVEVFSRARPADLWRPVANTVLYRMTRGDGEFSSPAVMVNANRDRYWLVRTEARGGGIGAATPTLEASWVPVQIAFVPRGAAPYALIFGHHQATLGALPLVTVVPGYRDGTSLTLPEARVARTLADNAQPMSPPPIPAAPRDIKAWTLWGVLAVGLLVLGAMAWRLARELGNGAGSKAGRTPPTDPPDGGGTR
ncbi:MAG: DUF3999 domain-containing protein [Burkholderiales bacterium]